MDFHSIGNLSPQDQALFNRFGRGKKAHLRHRTITAAFQAVAAAHPDAKAVQECFGGQNERSVTYGQLNSRANAVANLLVAQHGVRRGQRVVCVLSRCIEMCALVLGVMKAGAQYVPVDGAVVVEDCLRHIIQDSGAEIVLTLSEFTDKVTRSLPNESDDGMDRVACKVIPLSADDLLWQMTGFVRNPPAVEVLPGDGAYVIYTSGTTGQPKGVDVTHEGTCNTLLNGPAQLGITVGTSVACVLMLGFDMCAWEILGTLMNGGALYLRGSSRDAEGTSKQVWDSCLRRVQVVITTPSGAQKYLPRPADFPNIKSIAVGGEPCPQSLADKWASQANLWNVCGPTEISILNTAHLHKTGTLLPIGKPIPNTNVYILDEDRKPCKIGHTGVMWVGGLGVSRGYLNLPLLTDEKFVPDEFTKDGRKMFNTGDLGRWTLDGSLVHMGRQDDQVKVKGCRIELDGVAASVESFPHINKACVLKLEGQLCAFYSAGFGLVDEQDLRGHLARCLSHYAQPSRLIYVPVMPTTTRGKVDKKALETIAVSKAAMEVSDIARYGESNEQPPPPPPKDPDENSLVHWRSLDNMEKGEGIKSQPAAEPRPVNNNGLELPSKKGVHGWRWLRHTALSAYRKLFITILISNLIPFIAMWIRANSKGLPVDQVANAVAANLLVSVLVRQDYVVNFAFWLATRWPTSAPLWIRRHFARVYHIGGIHSGCSVFATLWWMVFCMQSTAYYFTEDETYRINGATVTLSLIIMLLLIIILILAHPAIRIKMHDLFESSHRFAGWTILALVWVQIIVSTASMAKDEPVGEALARSPALWMVFVTTLSILLPWVKLRRVKVVAEPLSKHAVRLHFDFCTPPSGKGIRIANNPMRDWHAFATITDPDKAGFSIIVSRAGDWTGKCIDNPPTRIWTRGIPASGVLRVAPLFRKVVLVATGSGIGPCLPVILASKVPCRVFWSTPNPEERYSQRIVDNVRAADPNAVIWNTRTDGRPNMALEAYKLYKESGAECVCVISNATLTAKLVYDLESRGIPAFGPVWDS